VTVTFSRYTLLHGAFFFIRNFVLVPEVIAGTRWRTWLRHCVTSRKNAASIPQGSMKFFID
jgi:hypothetical protein